MYKTSMLLLVLLSACGSESAKPLLGPSTQFVAGATGWAEPINLGPTVNSDLEDQDPSISRRALSLYFHSARVGGFGGFDIWVSRRARVDEPWGPPQNLGPAINTPFNELTPALSGDAHRLFFNSNRPDGFGSNDIYVSRRHDKREDLAWQSPVNLGSGVNSAANDAGPALFKDDATGTVTLYFNSNRPGGLGDQDIYASSLLGDETFGPAVLVEELSSPFVDNAPAIRRDGLELFLGSNRSGTLGGQDIWVATRASTSDRWSTPVNLGSPVNTVNFDAGPWLAFDGTELYFHSSMRPGNVSIRFDLWVAKREKLKGPDQD